MRHFPLDTKDIPEQNPEYWGKFHFLNVALDTNFCCDTIFHICTKFLNLILQILESSGKNYARYELLESICIVRQYPAKMSVKFGVHSIVIHSNITNCCQIRLECRREGLFVL